MTPIVLGLLPILITITLAEPVHQGKDLLKPLDKRQSGLWGAWSSWSPCSTTCGQGVSTQTRSCLTSSNSTAFRNINRQARCVGVGSRHVLCQKQPCLENQLTDPCNTFNKQQFRKRHYAWETHFKDECDAKCRPVGEELLLTLSTTFQDGTPCTRNDLQRGVCIQGVCKVIGCDGVIGSNSKLDNCGICGGNNNTCQIVSGLYTRLTLPVGYNVIAQLPVGSCNISVSELRLSKNYLALRTQNNGYIINGNWAINWSGEYEAAGTTFVYKRHDVRTQAGEKITARGPLIQSVELLLIYQQPNQGIKYEYSLAVNRSSRNPTMQLDGNSRVEPDINLVEEVPVRKKHPRRTHPIQSGREHHAKDRVVINHRRRRREYRWHVVGLGECSKSCGGGVQGTLVACVRRKTAITVDDHHCHGERKPDMQQVICNTEPCPARWRTTDWTPCSLTCGPGLQTRDVLCVQEPTSKLHDARCSEDERPSSSRQCQVAACFQWNAEEWTQCSVTCGEGRRRRTVQCMSGQEVVPHGKCTEMKPTEDEPCIMGSCKVTWFFTDWDDACSSQCTNGIQRRKIFCKGDPDVCGNQVKPMSTQPCSQVSACENKWFVGEWSKCPTVCGTGQQTREVVCLDTTNRSEWKLSESNQCSQENRPSETQICQNSACSAEWYTSEWSQCSKTCGTGDQTRRVMCLTSDQRESQECPMENKPSQLQSCSLAKCDSPSPKGVECTDKYNNCLLVVRARLCSYNYYRILCCSSCKT